MAERTIQTSVQTCCSEWQNTDTMPGYLCMLQPQSHKSRSHPGETNLTNIPPEAYEFMIEHARIIQISWRVDRGRYLIGKHREYQCARLISIICTEVSAMEWA